MISTVINLIFISFPITRVFYDEVGTILTWVNVSIRFPGVSLQTSIPPVILSGTEKFLLTNNFDNFRAIVRYTLFIPRRFIEMTVKHVFIPNTSSLLLSPFHPLSLSLSLARDLQKREREQGETIVHKTKYMIKIDRQRGK